MNPQTTSAATSATSATASHLLDTSQREAPIISRQEKPRMSITPLGTTLLLLTPEKALSQIANLTNSFCDLPFEYAQMIQFNIRNRQFTSYGVLPSPTDETLAKQIIGKDGYYLKLTTTKTGVDFIWHNRVKQEFQFWGLNLCCIRAMKEISYRIDKYAGPNVAPNVAQNVAPHQAFDRDTIGSDAWYKFVYTIDPANEDRLP